VADDRVSISGGTQILPLANRVSGRDRELRMNTDNKLYNLLVVRSQSASKRAASVSQHTSKRGGNSLRHCYSYAGMHGLKLRENCQLRSHHRQTVKLA